MLKIGLILVATWFSVWMGFIDDNSTGILAGIAKVTSHTFGGIPHLFLIVGTLLIVLGIFREISAGKDTEKE